MNFVILIGRIGRAPEFKSTPGGSPVCGFSLATNETIGRGKSKRQETTWHRIVCWNDLAEPAAKLKKGELISVEGSLQTSTWEDKHGNRRETVQVVCRRFSPLDGRPQS